jgi:hypothetical protein
MKKTLTTYEVAKALANDKDAMWTRSGAFALAEYLEQLEEDIGEEIELDVIALRCEYTEYESLEDFATDHFGSMYGKGVNKDEPKDLKEYIEDNGTLIEFDGGIIVHEAHPYC